MTTAGTWAASSLRESPLEAGISSIRSGTPHRATRRSRSSARSGPGPTTRSARSLSARRSRPGRRAEPCCVPRRGRTGGRKGPPGACRACRSRSRRGGTAGHSPRPRSSRRPRRPARRQRDALRTAPRGAAPRPPAPAQQPVRTRRVRGSSRGPLRCRSQRRHGSCQRSSVRVPSRVPPLPRLLDRLGSDAGRVLCLDRACKPVGPPLRTEWRPHWFAGVGSGGHPTGSLDVEVQLQQVLGQGKWLPLSGLMHNGHPPPS